MPKKKDKEKSKRKKKGKRLKLELKKPKKKGKNVKLWQKRKLLKELLSLKKNVILHFKRNLKLLPLRKKELDLKKKQKIKPNKKN